MKKPAVFKAFTLIELLIVVAIIAILAAIAVPNFLEAQTRSKVSRVAADQRSLATAIESYYVDNNRYPESIDPATGSTFVPRIRSYIRLTTPIAYISSAFPDPFNTKEAPPAGFTESDQRVLVIWTTDFLVETASGGDARARTATILEEFPEYVNADLNEVKFEAFWLSLSYSPDGDFDVLDDGFPTAIQQYDPTNGTISDGDVIRFKD